MTASDYMVRATAADAQVRAFAADTRGLVEEARRLHNTSPVATAALGRFLTAGVMMGSMLKGERDLLTLQVSGDGPLGGMTVTAGPEGTVKGYVNHPSVMLPPNAMGKLDVGGAVGKGTLRVIRDMGLKEPYVGQTRLQTGEIAEDLTYYFAISEQLPSTVGLGVLMERDNTVRRAGGFIVQLMPFAGEEVVGRLEKNLGGVSSVTSMLDRGAGPEELLAGLLEGLSMEIADKFPVSYRCDCGRERVERALTSLGRAELEEMIGEGKDVEVNCHFCGKSYLFSVDDLRKMAEVLG